MKKILLLMLLAGTSPAIAHMGHPFPTNQWIQAIRESEAKKTRTPIDEMINNSLLDLEYNYGSDGSTEQEELLQLPSNED